MMAKTGVVGIVVRPGGENVRRINALLSEFADIIVGRMGVPDRESGVNTIALIVRGENESISALCGKLGKIDSVRVKSAVVAVDAERRTDAQGTDNGRQSTEV
ncbi:MAG TPA: CopG family transcriptional regulator [Candidatus Ornithoclostridium excrementipullorum]|nr:CopG family transcriptional regulator [Candidatus Ornithoclostridium excrementipullorum]